MTTRLPPRGFTLVEVLLVILLIGMLAVSVVVSFSGDSRDQRLSKETEQLQQLIQLASETAMLKHLQRAWRQHHMHRHGFIVQAFEGGVVAHGDDRVGAQVTGMLEHVAIGLVARLLAQFGVDGDVAAEQRLQAAEEVAHDRSRPHGDAAHHAQVAADTVAGKLQCGRHHRVVQGAHPCAGRRRDGCVSGR